MGGVSEKTKIESRMLSLKLRRQNIQDEKKRIIKELEQMLKTHIIREPIPDYVEDNPNRTLKLKNHFYFENYKNDDSLDKPTTTVKSTSKYKPRETKDYFKKYLGINSKYKS